MGRRMRTFSKDGALVDARRDRIALMAARVFVKRGYNKATTREISKVSGMSVGALYHYVGKKQDVLYLTLERGLSKYHSFLEDVTSRLDVLPAPSLFAYAVEAYYRLIDETQDIILFAYQEISNLDEGGRKSVLDLERNVISLFEVILNKGVESGEFHVDNVKIMAHTVAACGQMWAVKRWFLKPICKLEEYIRQHVKLVTDYTGGK
jgi:AcrR family transcriptional regulator